MGLHNGNRVVRVVGTLFNGMDRAMSEQARKEIVDDVLNNRDELRRALIEGLEKDVGDGFLGALILVIERKNASQTRTYLYDAAKILITATEDIAIEYADSVNIDEDHQSPCR